MEVVKKQKDTTFPLFLPCVSLCAPPAKKGLPNFCPGTGLRFDARMRQDQGLLHAKNKGKLTRERQTKNGHAPPFRLFLP
jgi:hypothetical protein